MQDYVTGHDTGRSIPSRNDETMPAQTLSSGERKRCSSSSSFGSLRSHFGSSHFGSSIFGTNATLEAVDFGWRATRILAS